MDGGSPDIITHWFILSMKGARFPPPQWSLGEIGNHARSRLVEITQRELGAKVLPLRKTRHGHVVRVHGFTDAHIPILGINDESRPLIGEPIRDELDRLEVADIHISARNDLGLLVAGFTTALRDAGEGG